MASSDFPRSSLDEERSIALEMRERHHSDNDSRATLLPEHSPSPNHLRSSGRVDRTRSIRQAGVKLRNQFLRKGKPKIGILQSLKAIALSSSTCLGFVTVLLNPHS